MEKKKLKLDNIKVESFITKLNEEDKQTVIGGESQFWCSWLISGCALSFNCKSVICKTNPIGIHGCDQLNTSKAEPALCPGIKITSGGGVNEG